MPTPIAPDLYIIDGQMRILCAPMTIRATVVRASDDQLVLISPVPLSDDEIQRINDLGRVTAIVAPNLFHHLFIKGALDAFPDARLYAPPGLDAKRQDLTIDTTLTQDTDPAWADVMQQTPLRGTPKMNEFVFFHEASRTVIATDLVFNIDRSYPRRTKAFMRLAGAYNKLANSRIFRLLIKDREAFCASVLPIFEWDFDRLIMAHGKIVETGAKEKLHEALARFL